MFWPAIISDKSTFKIPFIKQINLDKKMLKSKNEMFIDNGID